MIRRALKIGLITSLFLVVIVAVLQSSSPILSVSEVASNPDKYMNGYVRVMGKVAGPYDPEHGTFLVSDEEDGPQLKVVYLKALPPNWKEGVRVLIMGRLIAPDTIEADQLSTECPTKYKP